MAESISFESIASEPIKGDVRTPEGASVATVDTQASAVASRMLAAFLTTFCAALGRIAPTAFRVTYGPGATPRVTLQALEAAHVSDKRSWYHVAAGRSSSARREGYVRACIAQAAMLLACGDRTMANLAMQAHGAETPEGAKPEQWARAFEGAEGACGTAFAALVSAQHGYVFPHGNRPKKTGKLAHRWVAEYVEDGKTRRLVIPAAWVPDPSAYDPDGDGTAVDRNDDAEIPSEITLFGIPHPVIVKRIIVRK